MTIIPFNLYCGWRFNSHHLERELKSFDTKQNEWSFLLTKIVQIILELRAQQTIGLKKDISLFCVKAYIFLHYLNSFATPKYWPNTS